MILSHFSTPLDIFSVSFEVLVTVFFVWRRAPQQLLRTHRSLKAYCATLVMKIKRKFLIFPFNGAPLE
jgi:hypothetical protein